MFDEIQRHHHHRRQNSRLIRWVGFWSCLTQRLFCLRRVTIVLRWPCVVDRMGDHCPAVTLCGQQDGRPLSCGDPVWSTGWVTIVLRWPCSVNRMGDHCPAVSLFGQQDGWSLSWGDPVWSTGWVIIVLQWPCAVDRTLKSSHWPTQATRYVYFRSPATLCLCACFWGVQCGSCCLFYYKCYTHSQAENVRIQPQIYNLSRTIKLAMSDNDTLNLCVWFLFLFFTFLCWHPQQNLAWVLYAQPLTSTTSWNWTNGLSGSVFPVHSWESAFEPQHLHQHTQMFFSLILETASIFNLWTTKPRILFLILQSCT